MGKKDNYKDLGELEFTRAAYDVVEDAQDAYGLLAAHSIHTTAQRGVLAFVTTYRTDRGGPAERPVIVQTSYWPNANGTSWAAFWFQHQHKAALMAEQWFKSEQERVSETGS